MRAFLAGILIAAVFLVCAGWVSADPGFTPDNAIKELKSVGKLLLGGVLVLFIVVGCYIIIQSLIDARQRGGWGHFVVGIVMVLVCGLALWALIGMAGEDPQKLTNSIKVEGN